MIEEARRADGSGLATGTTDNYIRVLIEDGGSLHQPQVRPHQLLNVVIDRAREDVTFASVLAPTPDPSLLAIELPVTSQAIADSMEL